MPKYITMPFALKEKLQLVCVIFMCATLDKQKKTVFTDDLQIQVGNHCSARLIYREIQNDFNQFLGVN